MIKMVMAAASDTDAIVAWDQVALGAEWCEIKGREDAHKLLDSLLDAFANQCKIEVPA
jgi:hypothetical protein